MIPRTRGGPHGSPDNGLAATSPTRWTMPVPRSSMVSTTTLPSLHSPLTQPITPTCEEGRGVAWPMPTTRHQGARGRRGTGVLPSTHGPTTATSRPGTMVRGPDRYPTGPTTARTVTTATTQHKTSAGMYLPPRAPRAPADAPPCPHHVPQGPASDNHSGTGPIFHAKTL